MKNRIAITIFILAIALSVSLFCGVYIHDEFAEKHFFIKHKPAWKWRFFSPLGQSDLSIRELSKQEQTEQKYFNEFVRDQGLEK
jgi:hypothetical protein